MSEKVEAQIINMPIEDKVTDEEFAMFVNALFGPYVGGGFRQE
jgi:hypothetical protein